jgi:glycosyltransferase involved in cell wall biosynthesis
MTSPVPSDAVILGRTSTVRQRVRRMREWLQAPSGAWLAESLAERRQVRDDRAALMRQRNGRDVAWLDEHETEPLVTVRIATYNRPHLLVDRAIQSARAQTYPRLEILVVGDHCDDRTRDALERVGDARIRYINLDRRTQYPQSERDRWLVVGWAPMNVGIAEAKGTWIAPLDDDDEFTPDHVATLLQSARERRVELVHSRTLVTVTGFPPVVIGSPHLQLGATTHGSVIYSAGLRHFRYSGTSFRLREPFDYNMWRRMMRAGVRIGFCDAVTYRYYPAAATTGQWESLLNTQRT